MTASMKSTNGDGFDTKLLLHALTAVKNGDFSARLPAGWTGLHGKIADVFNDIMGLNERLAVEAERAAKVVAKEGRIAHRASMGRVEGAWSSQAENLNALITDLTTPTREMARVIGAVAKGDLTQSVRAWRSKSRAARFRSRTGRVAPVAGRDARARGAQHENQA